MQDRHDRMIDCITFVLNGEVRIERAIAPTTTVLEYLRRSHRLTGTKEGCAEGDCGACAVVVSELCDGKLRQRAVNSCIQLLPMLAGKAITTVEHLKGPGGDLHPAQQALVESHGSQCGFCTPGFVMSLYVAFGSEVALPRARISDLLAGNLCRCTGYGPILEAAERMQSMPRPKWDAERQARLAQLVEGIDHQETVRLAHEGQVFFSPASIDELARIYAQHPDATIVAGATDVALWITKQHRRLATVIHIGRVRELKDIRLQDGVLRIGAGVTYRDAQSALAGHWPDLGELIRRLGSPLVRNMGTIGGNIANGSPIGDMPPALIALGAHLVLRRGNERRRIPLEDFFLSYGQQDRAPGELVEAVEVPLGTEPEQLKCYKVSKRFDQDISAVCGCFNIEITSGSVAAARICFGGMAGTPKRARAVEAALIGRPWSAATLEAAVPAFELDYAPIGDVRGSAGYRMLTAKNLLRRYFHESRKPLSMTRLVGRATTSVA